VGGSFSATKIGVKLQFPMVGHKLVTLSRTGAQRSKKKEGQGNGGEGELDRKFTACKEKLFNSP